MQLIYVIKAQGTNIFQVHWVLYQLENCDPNWPPYWIYAN